MTRYKAPTPPVVGGHPAKHSGRRNRPINRVVIHSAVMPCERDRARQLADWNFKGVGGGSWHYSVDPIETIQCSYDSYICWHAPPNSYSIGIEMADDPTLGRRRWKRKVQHDMLIRTAVLTAELCLAYDLPVRFVGARALRKGKRGITTHGSVSKAWGQSTHWDPGAWPRRKFMRAVRREVTRLKART